MSQFEFFMMIGSVLVAIGIAEVIGGWGRILRNNTIRVELDWLHIGTCILAPLTIIQYWIGMWAYSDLEFTNNLQILFLVLPSVFLVLTAYIITPGVNESTTLNCREYYMSRRRPYFFNSALGGWSAGIADIVIAGTGFLDPFFIAFFFLLPFALLYLAFTTRVWIHGMMMALGYWNAIYFYMSEFAELGARFT